MHKLTWEKHADRKLTLVSGALVLLLAILTLSVLSHSPVVRIDGEIEQYLFSIRDSSLLSLFSFITLLGNSVVVSIITTLLACLFFFRNQTKYAGVLLISVLGAAGTDFIMKVLIERARPLGPIPTTIETSFSFPSGHATAAAALYGAVAYYLWQRAKTTAQKCIALGSMLTIIGLVGFSRLYLGVHFPSDVVAGYILGTLWLVIGVHLDTIYYPWKRPQ